MESYTVEKNDKDKRKYFLEKVSNFVKSKLLSTFLRGRKIDKALANNLYANRVLEEELMAPNISYRGFQPELPKGSELINFQGSQYLRINGRMYYIRNFTNGFDLVDNTYDFMPRPDEVYPSQTKLKLQRKYNVSDTSPPIDNEQFYTFNETKDDLDNWIIHNDMGKIKNDRFNQTWWRKGQPYKPMEERSLFDKPKGRHLFVKQSALEASVGAPLNQHRELLGDVIATGSVQNGGITITSTREADLPNIEGVRSFTYNPITGSMERGIFSKPNKLEDEKDMYKLENYRDVEK